MSFEDWLVRVHSESDDPADRVVRQETLLMTLSTQDLVAELCSRIPIAEERARALGIQTGPRAAQFGTTGAGGVGSNIFTSWGNGSGAGVGVVGSAGGAAGGAGGAAGAAGLTATETLRTSRSGFGDYFNFDIPDKNEQERFRRLLQL